MSNYRNFVDDFPHRCGTVLDAFMNVAVENDREVTLMLMAAGAGFIAPYERLKKDGLFPHPLEDNKRFEDRAEKFMALLDTTVSKSELWDSHLDRWTYSGLDNPKFAPEEWHELRDPQVLSGDTPTGEVIDTIRHALAHSAVLSQHDGKNQISHLLFVSENRRPKHVTGPYRFVRATPEALRVFLMNWFELMKTWGMTQHEIGVALAERNVA